MHVEHSRQRGKHSQIIIGVLFSFFFYQREHSKCFAAGS